TRRPPVVENSVSPPLTVNAQVAFASGQWVSGVPAEATAGSAAKARAVSAFASSIIFLLMSCLSNVLGRRHQKALLPNIGVWDRRGLTGLSTPACVGISSPVSSDQSRVPAFSRLSWVAPLRRI